MVLQFERNSPPGLISTSLWTLHTSFIRSRPTLPLADCLPQESRLLLQQGEDDGVERRWHRSRSAAIRSRSCQPLPARRPERAGGRARYARDCKHVASSPFQVRRATFRDAGAIAALHVRSWQWAYRGLLPDAYL